MVNTLAAVYFFKFQDKPEQNIGLATSENEPTVTTINALGRIEPQGATTNLSTTGQRLAQVLVKEGDIVQAGQVIAIADSVHIRKAALEEANAKVQTAQANLTKIQAGTKVADINAQRSKVAMLEAQWAGDIATQETKITQLEVELRNAAAEYQRHLNLYQKGAISASEFETQKLTMESLQEQVQGAEAMLEKLNNTGQAQVQTERETLNSISEVRSIDVVEAQARVAEALALQSKAEADLDLVYVRSPIEGQILNLHVKAGETIGSRGIAEIGKTQQMYAVAEIYETDIRHIRIGQKATLTSEFGGFIGELTGTVDQIGLQIGKPGTVNNNPSAVSDVRVVEVKIRLNPEDSDRVKHLNKLQVRASIQI